MREPFAAMNREGDAWIVNDSIRARCVVGAGGHFCPVARLMAGKTCRTSGGSVDEGGALIRRCSHGSPAPLAHPLARGAPCALV